MRLYINGQLADLSSGTVIEQTKQTNDIASIETRNSNYTNTFDLPKTANNSRIFEFLDEITSTTVLPYRKISVSLFADTGECYVNKGWGTVVDNGSTYKVDIIDGIIDLYKIIENQPLSALPLSELTHTKDVTSIINTWNNELPYRYILADFNGKTGETNTSPTNTTPQVNIDYVVPSVNVYWLWNRIFDFFGIEYSGSVFNTFNFKNLWMPYPKGFSTNNLRFNSTSNTFQSSFFGHTHNYLLAKPTATPTGEELIYNEFFIKVTSTGKYRLEITGKLYGYDLSLESRKDVWVRIGKNAENLATQNTDNWPSSNYVTNGDTIFGYSGPYQYNEFIAFGADINLSSDEFELQENDTLCIRLNPTPDYNSLSALRFKPEDDNNLHVKLFKTESVVINFADAFKDFAISDFIKEIVQRFGLTIYKDKYSNVYNFLTLQEVFQNNDIYDWSDKYISNSALNRKIGSYCQQNNYRYTYNDKESTYNDSYIAIANDNLDPNKTIFVSKLYSPERVQSTYIDESTNVYKLWDREPNDDATDVKYNPLDRRYFFIRSDRRDVQINVLSEQQASNHLSNFYYRESFYKLSFSDILSEYYSNISRILNNAIVVTANMWLSENDICNLDFKKPVFIKQLSNYFLINKINNYVPGKHTKVDLIRLIYTDENEAEGIRNITITNLQRVNTLPTFKAFNAFYISNYDIVDIKAQYSVDSTTWIDAPAQDFNDTSVGFLLPIALTGLVYIRLFDAINLNSSNVEQYTF